MNATSILYRALADDRTRALLDAAETAIGIDQDTVIIAHRPSIKKHVTFTIRPGHREGTVKVRVEEFHFPHYLTPSCMTTVAIGDLTQTLRTALMEFNDRED